MKRCKICLQELQGRQTLWQWLLMEDQICAACRSCFVIADQTIELEGLQVHVLCLYDDYMEKLLFQLKEGRDIALASVFFYPFDTLFRKYKEWNWVLMPCSEQKYIERGFIPLREMLADMHHALYEPLYKKTDFKQSTRSIRERVKVNQEIELKQEYPIPQGKILLIDDVCTSGATIKRAYHLLRGHSTSIEAIVLCAHPLLLE